MRKFLGKTIFDSLEEVLRPEHSVILVVDMQEECHTDASCCGLQRDMSLLEECTPRAVALIDAARRAGVRVAWIRNVPSAARECVQSALAPGLNSAFAQAADEILIEKAGANAFIGTSLEIVLRQLGVKTTITLGLTTEGCVESTAEGAIHADFHSVVARDCVASFSREMHEASLSILDYRCDLVSSEKIVSVWTGRDA